MKLNHDHGGLHRVLRCCHHTWSYPQGHLCLLMDNCLSSAFLKGMLKSEKRKACQIDALHKIKHNTTTWAKLLSNDFEIITSGQIKFNLPKL